MSENILYAGYGANRDPHMLHAITGVFPLLVSEIKILDAELGVQTLGQIPNTVADGAPRPLSAAAIIKDRFAESADSFAAYTIRRKSGSYVWAKLYNISQNERDDIAEWQLIQYGWLGEMVVQAESNTHKIYSQVITDGLRDGQSFQAVSSGDYFTHLNRRETMYAAALRSRREWRREKQTT